LPWVDLVGDLTAEKKEKGEKKGKKGNQEGSRKKESITLRKW